MPVKRKYIPNKQLVYIKGFGDIKYEESLNTIKYLMDLMEGFEVTDVFIDHSEVETIPNMVEAFNLGSLMGHKFRQLKFALIYRSIFQESYSMFKNAGAKRGANIKLFNNKPEALNRIINSGKCALDKEVLMWNCV